jgi:hypothetical protein
MSLLAPINRREGGRMHERIVGLYEENAAA